MYNHLEEVFDHRYKFISTLGSGGMGDVYLAITNDRLEQKRAIKEVNCANTVGADVLHEAFILKDLEHDGIPRIIEIKEHQNKIYIVQEYIQGKSLHEIIQKEGMVADKILINWFSQLIDILDYIHAKKIVHRDIKPQNIMLTDEGKIKLIDFGIASVNAEEVQMSYSPIFASPEQINGKVIDGQSDIYSLGITFLYLLTKNTPKTDKQKTEYISFPTLDKEKYNAGFVHIIEKSSYISPNKRYKSIQELQNDLKKIHKYSASYKKHRWVSDIKIGLIILLFILSSGMIVMGKQEIAIETYDYYVSACNNAMAEFETNYDFNNVKEKLSIASEILPFELNAYQYYAEVLILEKKYDECLEYINNVFYTIENAELDDQLNYIAGTAYFEKEDYNKAVLCFEKVNDDALTNETYIRDLGVSYAKIGKYEMAEKAIKCIKDQNISNSITYYVLGEVEHAKGNVNNAYEYFEKALAETEDEELIRKAYINMATILRENATLFEETEKKAVTLLETARNTLDVKNDFEMIELLAQAYFNYANVTDNNQDLLHQSSEEFEKLLTLGCEMDYIYNNIAIINIQLKDYEKAEEILLEMIEEYPLNYQGRMQITWLYLQKQAEIDVNSRNYSEAVDSFNILMKEYDVEPESEFIMLDNKMKELVEKRWIVMEDLHYD